MKVKKYIFQFVQFLFKIKTTAVYLAPKGNLLIFYKTEDGTIKETVTETFEILLPNMNLP